MFELLDVDRRGWQRGRGSGKNQTFSETLIVICLLMVALPQWEQLRAAGAAALEVFLRRGIFSDERECAFNGND